MSNLLITLVFEVKETKQYTSCIQHKKQEGESVVKPFFLVGNSESKRGLHGWSGLVFSSITGHQQVAEFEQGPCTHIGIPVCISTQTYFTEVKADDLTAAG